MQILEEIMSTEQEDVVGGPFTSVEDEIPMECIEQNRSISVQCNLSIKACCTVECQTETDHGLYEAITDEDDLDSPTKSQFSVDCSDREPEE